MSLPTSKEDLRPVMQSVRKEAAAAVGAEAAAEALRRHLVDLLQGQEPGCVVSGYIPLGDEIDPRPALSALSELGHRPCLPVVLANKSPLIFRAWTPGEALEPGPFKTQHPPVDAQELMPDVILVPLLAFDALGNRLGWGGGFYDRTLRQHRGLGMQSKALGIAYSAQQVDTVPSEAYDQPLDAVLTEAGLMKVSR